MKLKASQLHQSSASQRSGLTPGPRGFDLVHLGGEMTHLPPSRTLKQLLVITRTC